MSEEKRSLFINGNRIFLDEKVKVTEVYQVNTFGSLQLVAVQIISDGQLTREEDGKKEGG